MVLGTMRGYGAVITGDRELAAQIAAAAEEYGDTEGIVTLCAEAAWMWWGAGRPERARGLVERFDADVVAGLPRDFNYLLTVQLALDVALETGADRVVEALTPALLPYAGRAVINAGAVMFHGVTDDPLSRATAALGDHDLSSRLRTSALSTYRRIGASWWRKRLEAALPDNRFRSMTLRRGPVDGWLVGRPETPIKDRRGLDYLHTLIAAPGRELHVGQLAGVNVEQADLGPIADATALAAYRRRLRQLDDELDQADKTGDAATGRRAHTEQQALLRQIAAATGSGRPRTHGSTSERARVAVKKAITAALLAIAEADPDMAEHLRQHIDTGTYCRYRPSTTDPVTWRL